MRSIYIISNSIKIFPNFIVLGFQGTEFVEGIVLKMPVDKNEPLSAEVFSKMKNLRFLKIGYLDPQQGHNRGHVQLPQGLN